MEFTKLKKVVIVTEYVIKDKVLHLITSLGAKGYIIDTICGNGEIGLRNNENLLGEYLKNIKIEIISSDEIADKIAITVEEKFFNNYTGIVYTEDVKVLKKDKFITP